MTRPTLRPALGLPALLLAGVALATATPARAGEFGITALGGYFSMSASDTAKAVFDGSSGGVTFGGELSYSFGQHFFVAAGVRSFSKEGTKVFVEAPGQPVYPMPDNPLELKLTPIYGTLGYRFGQGGIVPYVGLGGGITSYEQKTTVGGLVETTSADKASFHGLVGVEFVTGHLRIGVEGVYQSVPDAFGESGVSQVYDESDAGGLLVLGKLTFTFGSK